VADINPGSPSSFPSEFVSLSNGQALFTADDGIHGRELWWTDGTAQGTQLLSDLNPGASSSNPNGFVVVAPPGETGPTLGDDTIIGTAASDTLFGDTGGTLSDDIRGGNDRIFGLGNIDYLFGDASVMTGNARGGNDRLDGGGGNDLVVGDSGQMMDHAQGGNDDLFGKAGSDSLLGDAVPPCRRSRQRCALWRRPGDVWQRARRQRYFCICWHIRQRHGW
jgi:ELWxxDGT repeat protein